MKNYIILLLCFFGIVANAQKQDVQKSIEIFFEGFHQKDTTKIKSVCSDKMILQSISESAAKGISYQMRMQVNFINQLQQFLLL